MNNTTRSHPRTLEAAFGPSERGGIYTPPEPLHPHDRIVLRACAVALVALLVTVVFWGGA